MTKYHVLFGDAGNSQYLNLKGYSLKERAQQAALIHSPSLLYRSYVFGEKAPEYLVIGKEVENRYSQYFGETFKHEYYNVFRCKQSNLEKIIQKLNNDMKYEQVSIGIEQSLFEN